MSRALLAVALSGHRTLAVTVTGPGLLRGRSDLARDQVSRLQGFSPSGNPYLCAAGLEWNRGRCPPGFHPPQGLPLRGPPRNRRSSSALALRLTDSLAGVARGRAPASCQTRKWRCLSRDCQPSRGSSLVPTRLFESPCGAGLLIPLGDVVPLPDRRLPSVRRLAPCRSSTGLAFRAASSDP